MTEGTREWDRHMNLPNRLTLARVIMAPVFVVLMSFDMVSLYILAYAVFTAAIVTDYYDGKIARERNLVSNFGKLWDPVADKVIMTAAFVMMMPIAELWIPAWTVVAILAREFIVTGARSYAASDGQVIAANQWGKAKTVIQMVYIMVFLFLVVVGRILGNWMPEFAEEYFLPALRYTSRLTIVAVALFTLYTGLQFARMNWQSLGMGKWS